jgi:hypothetical protein
MSLLGDGNATRDAGRNAGPGKGDAIINNATSIGF